MLQKIYFEVLRKETTYSFEMNYHEIKRNELTNTEKFSDRKYKIYLKAHYVLRYVYSELFFWTLSFATFIIFPIIFGQTSLFGFFLISHFLYWKFFGERKYHELCDNDIEELELTIQVLEDIQKERTTVNI